MQDTNQVTIIGRLTRDAELKYTNSGLAISNFSIAMSKSIKQGDKWEDATIFINDLALFGKRAEGLNQYLSKGQQVAIEGSLDVDTWEQDGKNRSRLKVHVNNIQLLGGKRDNHNSGQPAGGQNNNTGGGYESQNNQQDFEDEILF